MAYLNVRDRRVEAKIAYVGPALSGRSTNLEQLLRKVDARIADARIVADTGALALAWRPSSGERFRDCTVSVSVVAPSPKTIDAVLREADGVVVVMSAQADAQEPNRAALDGVREALAGRALLPVVVQVNKSDLPDALPAPRILGSLDVPSLRHVVASASRGEGVVETLEAVLDEVLSSLEADRTPTTRAGAPTNAPSAPTGEHPLLDALREVLRDAVRENVLLLEERMNDRIRDRLEARVDALEKSVQTLRTEVADSLVVTDDSINRIHARINDIAEELKKRSPNAQ
jgi:hypothetical protein